MAKTKDVKISRINPANIKSLFANDLIVNHTDDEFFLTFSLMEPIPILDEQELTNIDKIDAIAVAKITVTPKFAQAIVNTLSSNIGNYKKRISNNGKDIH